MMESTVAPTRLRAAIYARISKDRTGQEAGTTRQIEDCLKLAQDHGLTVVATFKDNDMSAYSGKPRPQFEDMVRRLRNGEFDAIVCYHVNRLYRRTKDLERLVDIIGENPESGIQIHTVKSADLDLSTSSGRMVARITGAIAQGQSEESGERIQRAVLADAIEGKPHGHRAYGYEADGVTICKREADILNEVAQKLLGGASLYAVSKELNQRGDFTVPQRRHFEDGTCTEPQGKPWRPNTLKRVLLKRRNIGQREHLPVIQGETATARKRRTPMVYDAQWAGILDPETYDALVRMFNRGNVKGAGAKGGPVPTHLGSGLYVCGACGHATMNQTTGHGITTSYRCTKRNAPGGKHVSRNAKKFDMFVQDTLCEYLMMHDFVTDMCEAVRGNDAETAALVAEQEKINAFLDALEVDDDADGRAAQALNRIVNAKTQRLQQIRNQLDALDKRS
jgi:site-specific DNA recombinase